MAFGVGIKSIGIIPMQTHTCYYEANQSDGNGYVQDPFFEFVMGVSQTQCDVRCWIFRSNNGVSLVSSAKWAGDRILGYDLFA